MATLKIRIPAQTVEVDAEAWAREYGIEVEDVREDVKHYFRHIVENQLEYLGLGPKGEKK